MRPKPRTDPYGAIARCYGACIDPFMLRWQRKALAMWPPQGGMHVLDVGCGTGAQLKLYRLHGCRVYGIDISAGMIAAASRKFAGHLHLCRANAVHMPYRDQTFDLILLSMMIHEIPPDTRPEVLSEAKRVLKDGGRMLIIDYRFQRAQQPLPRLFRGAVSVVERMAGRPHFTNYRNFMKTGGLPPLLKKHGLIVQGHGNAGWNTIGLNMVRKDQPGLSSPRINF